MRKTIFTLMLCLISAMSFAQQEKGTFALQPKAGVNVSTIGSGTWKPGFVGGFEGTYQFSEPMSVSFGALFSMQGAKVKKENLEFVGDGIKSASVTMGYINIPVLLNCYIFNGFSIKAGIQPGFNIYNRISAKNYEGNKLSENTSDGVSSVDLAIPVGLSYELGPFVIDGRYNIGVTDALEGDGGHSNVLQFTFGYKFRL